MTEPLFADPTQEFLDRDPTALVPPDFFAHPEDAPNSFWDSIRERMGNIEPGDVAGVIGAAYVTISLMQGRGLGLATGFAGDIFRNLTTPIAGVLGKRIKSDLDKYRNGWTHLVRPSLMEVYAAGVPGSMSAEDQYAYATQYAHQIFGYFNQTNAEALAGAYEEQLSKKWSPDIAWARTVQATGLNKRDMRQYLSLLREKGGPIQIVGQEARRFFLGALAARGDILGKNETAYAKQAGKQLVWMSQQRKGLIPLNAHKRWETAEDERTCKICAPMDRVEVLVDEQFELPDGNKVWSPTVHPRCRCNMRLVYPEDEDATWITKAASTLGNGEWDDEEHPRGEGGRFTRVAEREAEAPEVVAPTRRAQAPQRVASPTRQEVVAPTRQEVVVPTRQEVATPVRQEVMAPTRPQTVMTPKRGIGPVTQLVMRPVRQEAELETQQVDETQIKTPGSEAEPLFVWAGDFESQRSGESDWNKHSDKQWKINYIVNFDEKHAYNFGNESLIASPEMHIESMSVDASDKYNDLYRYEENVDDDALDNYSRSIANLHDYIEKNAYAIAIGMSPSTVDEVIQESGRDVIREFKDYQSNEDKKIELVRRMRYAENVDPDLMSSFTAKVLEKPEAYTSYMKDAQRVAGMYQALEEDGLQKHIPQVFIFNRGLNDGTDFIETRMGTGAEIKGEYVVYNTRIVPLGEISPFSTPSNMQSIRYVYLRPVGSINKRLFQLDVLRKMSA